MSVNTTSTTGLGIGVVQDAYDRLVEFDLRSQPLIRSVADKRPGKQAMPGDTVTLQIFKDLAPATTELVETTDVNAVLVPDTDKVTITIREFGNVIRNTRKLRKTALTEVDPAVANIIAYNQADSIDIVAETTLRGGTNVVRANAATLFSNGGTTGAIAAGDTLSADHIRLAVTRLRGRNAMGRRGAMYHALVHPDVSYDLRRQTGDQNWRTPHNYVDTQHIYAGEIGEFEGAYFVESPRLFSATDGATSRRVFRGYIVGKQALAEAVVEEPHVVMSPVTDHLNRFQPIGWYGLLGFAIYRQNALVRLETSSSITAS